MNEQYPVQYSVDYPDRSLNRLTTFFRLFTVIPIAIILDLLLGYSWNWTDGGQTTTYVAGGVGFVFIPPLLMILFRKKYPRWWFDWNLELLRFANRVWIYFSLMDDTYPSTDDHQSVRLDYPYPDAQTELGRGMPLVKWFLAIPHYIVLIFLHIGAFFAVVFAWFAILFTGRYPRGLFEYVQGVYRWNNRVNAYAFILVTDKYPPFRLAQ